MVDVSYTGQEVFERELSTTLEHVRNLLRMKNRKYGDAALRPNPITSASDAIKIRMLDKMRRIESGQSDEDEDVWLDLLGYGVLLEIARGREVIDDLDATIVQPPVAAPPVFACKITEEEDQDGGA